MRKIDFQKSADELESDSCFDLLGSCNNRIAAVQAKLTALRHEATNLKFGSPFQHANYCAQRECVGEVFGLAYMQGALEAHCNMKTNLAAIVREREAS